MVLRIAGNEKRGGGGEGNGSRREEGRERGKDKIDIERKNNKNGRIGGNNGLCCHKT